MSNKCDNTCVVCFKNVVIYSVGCCDHVVCFECSTRMRVLCRQNECPICRQDMQLVVFTKEVAPYNELKNHTRLLDKKYNIAFASHAIQDAFYKLLEHRCSQCSNKTFRRFQDLNEHMKKVHELYYCDLCVNNLKILTSERRCYTKAELAQHRKKGDADDKSHRGHPLCEFCDTRFMDNDELYRHLRREHLYCHFCDADGDDMYYSSYSFLREHFRRDHYLCEEGTCVDEKFTRVFRTEIDLRAHRASEHGRTLGKVAAKQARTLEVEFTLKPRPRTQDNRRRPRDVEPSVEEQEYEVEPGKPETAPQLTPSDFPSLGNAAGFDPMPLHSYGGVKTVTYRKGLQYEQNFPGLPGGGAASVPSTSVSVNFKPDRKQNNVSITVNHRPAKLTQEAFPALMAGQPSSSSSSSSKSLNWVSVSKTSSKKTPAPAPLAVQQPPQPPREEDFPTLSTKIANLNVTKPPMKANFVNLNQSNMKKKASSVTIPVEKSWPAPAPDSPQPKTSKTKKKKKTEDNVKKKEEPKKEDDCALTDLPPPLPTAADWFGLQNGTSSRQSVPPGFETLNGRGMLKGHPSVPPGFEMPSNGLTAFTNSSGEMFPILAATAPFLPPPDFAERNAQALTKVNEILLNSHRLDAFRMKMAEFRDGQIPADAFVSHCLDTMGREGVSETLPELLVLLPDIGKQLQLFSVLERLGFSRTGKKKLESCRVCRQVVTAADMKHHLTNHVLNYS